MTRSAALGFGLLGLGMGLGLGALSAPARAQIRHGDSSPTLSVAPPQSMPASVSAQPCASGSASEPAAGSAGSEAPARVASEAPPGRVFSRRFGGASLEFDFGELPPRLAAPALRPLWLAGLEAERREALLESAQHYERIVQAVPQESYSFWRIARNYWRYGESLPIEAKQDRLHYFGLARDWAGRGLDVDPECAACMLWKFVSMGRQATTLGLWSAVGDVREMQRLLRGGIALQPRHADDTGNSVLGNLYYAGAVFYRVIPDWFWLRWFIGVRGDKERSLAYARKAVERSPVRVDYRVELGAVLLCLGQEKDRSAEFEEGVRVLKEARQLDVYLSTDSLDIAQAGVLIATPEKACGYSRDGFIDVDQVLEKADAQR